MRADIDLPDAVRQAYARLIDAFVVMSRCERVWDTLSRTATDRVRTRSPASHSIERRPVRFVLGESDLIDSEWKVPFLQNANGANLYLYPGFVLCHVSAEQFALVETRDLTVDGSPAAFIEEEPLPADTRVLRHAWAKSNKDGSPDRRCADNRQIPVVEYGRITLQSSSGLNEEWMLSNWPAVSRFVTLQEELRAAIARGTENAAPAPAPGARSLSASGPASPSPA